MADELWNSKICYRLSCSSRPGLQITWLCSNDAYCSRKVSTCSLSSIWFRWNKFQTASIIRVMQKSKRFNVSTSEQLKDVEQIAPHKLQWCHCVWMCVSHIAVGTTPVYILGIIKCATAIASDSDSACVNNMPSRMNLPWNHSSLNTQVLFLKSITWPRLCVEKQRVTIHIVHFTMYNDFNLKL